VIKYTLEIICIISILLVAGVLYSSASINITDTSKNFYNCPHKSGK